MVDFLISKGADFSVKDANGNTAEEVFFFFIFFYILFYFLIFNCLLKNKLTSHPIVKEYLNDFVFVNLTTRFPVSRVEFVKEVNKKVKELFKEEKIEMRWDQNKKIEEIEEIVINFENLKDIFSSFVVPLPSIKLFYVCMNDNQVFRMLRFNVSSPSSFDLLKSSIKLKFGQQNQVETVFLLGQDKKIEILCDEDVSNLKDNSNLQAIFKK